MNRIREGYASFKTSIPDNVAVVDVPLGNEKAIDIIFGKDSEPIEFINVVMLGEDYPVFPWGEEVILTETWGQSFASAVNDKPGLVYLEGHEDIFQYKTRALASGYIVGAKVEKDTLYLRNRLIPKTSPEGKDRLEQTMKEIRAGLLSTSTGDFQRYEWKEVVKDGNKKIVGFAVESMKAQSNALVEWDMTGSEAHIIASSFREQRAVGTEQHTEGDEDMILNGKDISVDEFFSALSSSVESKELAVSDIASRLGLDLMTDEKRAALKKVEDLEFKVGDLDEFVKQVEETRQETFKQLLDASLLNTFKTDELVEAARELVSLSEGSGEDVKKEVERLSGLKVIQSMQKAYAGSINTTPGADGTDEGQQDDPANVGTMEA